LKIEKLFETQKKLDDRIVEEKGLQGIDLLPKKILALLTELGELSNEWQGFKFWKENNEPVRSRSEHDFFSDEVIREYDPLLEEYVDCLHFILSIGNNLKFDNGVYYTSHKDTIIEQFLYTIQKSGDLYRFKTLGNYEMLFCSFLALGDVLGFTWGQIEQAYYTKNKINHERQENNY